MFSEHHKVTEIRRGNRSPFKMLTLAALKGLDWGMEEKNGNKETSWKAVQARDMVLGPERQYKI